MTLLQVQDLKVSFSTRNGTVNALHGISFDLEAGQTLGIVGESGSGKSVTSLAVMRLLDRAGQLTGGRVLFKDRNITRAGAGELRTLRGAAMSMIFQNPRAALNPIRTVEQQIADVLRAHKRMTGAQATCLALSRTASRAAIRPTSCSEFSDKSFSSPRPITMKRLAGIEPDVGVNRNVSPSSPTNSPRLRRADSKPPSLSSKSFMASI